MKIALMHKEGRMKYVYEMIEREHDVELFDSACFDYDVIVMGMSYFDRHSFDEEYLVMVKQSVIFVCYDAIEPMKEKFKIVCLKESEDFLVKNAKITALGIMHILLESLDMNIKDDVVDVIGFGRCGCAIVELFKALGIRYRIVVKEVKEYEHEVIHYEEYLFKKPSKWIIQTAENCIFDKYWIQRGGGNSTIIDITRSFIGTSNLQNENINIYYAKGLPDRFFVHSGAKVYYEALKEAIL